VSNTTSILPTATGTTLLTAVNQTSTAATSTMTQTTTGSDVAVMSTATATSVANVTMSSAGNTVAAFSADGEILVSVMLAMVSLAMLLV
jgi:acid phosphatase class B